MATALATDLPIYRLDADTYRHLVEGGALDGLDVELRDGLLVEKHCDRGDAVHRVDAGTYHRMVATGALDGLRIELLDGLLVEMSPKSTDHILVLNRLMRHFVTSPRLWVQVQDPIEVAADAEAEPDLVIAEHGPRNGELLRTAPLVVEVTVSSHRVDRGRKVSLYAAAGIANYWLIDVPGRSVEVRTRPTSDGYGHCAVYHEGDRVPSPLQGVGDLDVAALFADATD